MVFCALQEAASSGVNWWQTIGGLLAVFALLVLSLRLLGRFNNRRTGGNAALLKVMPLGPKREIQVLRLHDTVHYIYRHENGLVQLEQQSLAQYEATDGSAPSPDAGETAPATRAASG